MSKKVKEGIAAHQLGVSVYTLQKWRVTGRGPPFYKVGRLILYDQDDLEAFLEANKFNSTSEYAAQA